MTKKRTSNKKDTCHTCGMILSQNFDSWNWKNKVYCEKHYDETVAEEENKNEVWEMLNSQ